jgi:hypothetical protein
VPEDDDCIVASDHHVWFWEVVLNDDGCDLWKELRGIIEVPVPKGNADPDGRDPDELAQRALEHEMTRGDAQGFAEVFVLGDPCLVTPWIPQALPPPPGQLGQTPGNGVRTGFRLDVQVL